jgi:BirA family biotin operon repressor/biotin-[acetyl-CoA-carboxylase] ligase
MSELAPAVFRRLADGEFHSGAALAAELGVTRSAVWKSVRLLRALGADIDSIPRRGYRLPAGAPGGAALDAVAIRAALSGAARARVESVDVAWSTASTNSVLLERTPPPVGGALVQLAEYQSAGRGRRGRRWLAPLGGALCLSMGWSFAQLPHDVAALSLAVGVAVRRVAVAWGLRGVMLKWPNDVVVDDRKLGGILIELRAEAAGPAYVVIGIGLNVAVGPMHTAALAELGAAAVDFRSLHGAAVNRNLLAARLISELIETLLAFTSEGFAPFAAEWASADALRGRAIRLECGGGTREGIARGIDPSGALQIETALGLERHLSAEVSVRAQVAARPAA